MHFGTFFADITSFLYKKYALSQPVSHKVSQVVTGLSRYVTQRDVM